MGGTGAILSCLEKQRLSKHLLAGARGSWRDDPLDAIPDPFRGLLPPSPIGSCTVSEPAISRGTWAPRAEVAQFQGNRYTHSLGCYCLPFCFAKRNKSPKTSESGCQKILCKLPNHMGSYLEQASEKREVFSCNIVWINCLTLRHKIVKCLAHSDDM